MSKEDFRIRIKPNGQIYFSSRHVGQERLRQLREMLEDCLGPVVETRASDGDVPPGVGVVDEDTSKELHGKV